MMDEEGRKLAAFRIGTRLVGDGHPVFVIAEIGINHEGDPDVCLQMVEEAAKAGADAVKLQTIDADENYVPGTESHEIFSRAWISREATAEAFALARSLGMEAFTTCGDITTLSWVDCLNPSAHKISSGLITHLPLIQAAAETGKPIILSSGMCGTDEIRRAIETAYLGGAKDICVLQCTSIYPASPESLNLRAIRTLSAEFGIPAGFSDHSVGCRAAALAVAAGASVLEKHFSLDPSRLGFDHRLSLDRSGLTELVAAVREAETMLGKKEKILSEAQRASADRYLRSIVARRDIADGERLTLENTGFMRTQPDKRGLSPANWREVAGGRVVRSIKRYQAIRSEDLRD